MEWMSWPLNSAQADHISLAGDCLSVSRSRSATAARELQLRLVHPRAAWLTEGTRAVQAIAASPKGAVNGYAIGSYLYLGIVYIFPIGLGLGGLCLDLPVRGCLPLYCSVRLDPSPCTESARLLPQINLNEVYGELAFPAQAYALLGQPGAVAINCVIFMAVRPAGCCALTSSLV